MQSLAQAIRYLATPRSLLQRLHHIHDIIGVALPGECIYQFPIVQFDVFAFKSLHLLVHRPIFYREIPGTLGRQNGASTQVQLGNYETALALYDGILGRADSDYIKAQALYEAGLANQAQGQNAEANERFRYAVENYPLSYFAYLSLVELVDAGATV